MAAWQAIAVPGMDLEGVPYSPAGAIGDVVYLSGHISTDPTGAIVADDFAAQAARTFASLGATLAAAGCGASDVVHIQTILVRRADFDAFNDAFRTFFRPPYPARITTIGELIVDGLLIECSAVAVRPRAGDS